jgi:hypothetical protein
MFEQYIVKCQNPYCSAFLWLPSEQEFINCSVFDDCDNFPEEQLWPPQEWLANLACSRCGEIREYEAEQVDAFLDDERLLQPKCLRVDMGCAKPDCKRAVHFFIAKVAERGIWGFRGNGDDVDLNSDVVPLLRDGFFKGKCPKGHDLDRLPIPLYKVTPQTGHIPSHHEDLNWAQHSSRLIGSPQSFVRRKRTR